MTHFQSAEVLQLTRVRVTLYTEAAFGGNHTEMAESIGEGEENDRMLLPEVQREQV